MAAVRLSGLSFSLIFDGEKKWPFENLRPHSPGGFGPHTVLSRLYIATNCFLAVVGLTSGHELSSLVIMALGSLLIVCYFQLKFFPIEGKSSIDCMLCY